MRNTFFTELHYGISKSKDIYFLTGDLGFGLINDIEHDFPDNILNMGIAEQNMMGFAAGLALTGKKVFAYSIGNFSTIRCLEQIRNDICYHDADVKIVCVGGGYTYGQLGMSHHATEDISIMRAIPNLEIFAPCDDIECKAIMDYLFLKKGPAYLRLERNTPSLHSDNINFSVGRLYYLKKNINSKTLIISYGSIVSEAIKANEICDNIADVASCPTIKPLNSDYVAGFIQKYKNIICVEENNKCGGLNSFIAQCIATHNLHIQLSVIAINDFYSSIVGDQNYLRNASGISCDHIVKELKRINENK